jgi:hypothetical protein
MRTKPVECLNCGQTRRLDAGPSRPLADDGCSRCGYLGWGEAASLTETLRRLLREIPLEQRRTSSVAW